MTFVVTTARSSRSCECCQQRRQVGMGPCLTHKNRHTLDVRRWRAERRALERHTMIYGYLSEAA